MTGALTPQKQNLLITGQFLFSIAHQLFYDDYCSTVYSNYTVGCSLATKNGLVCKLYSDCTAMHNAL